MFRGSVFSPYAAVERRRGRRVDPDDHVAVNVALDRGGRHFWTFTERGRRQLAKTPRSLAIGPSRIERTDDGLSIDLCEWTFPFPHRVVGHLTIRLDAARPVDYALDAAGQHRWSPLSPRARIEVDFEKPRMRWQGTAYVDTNRGERPLERDFRRWSWSRSELADGRSAVFYDPEPLAGAATSRALLFEPGGGGARIESPPRVALARSGWGMERVVRSGGTARVVRTLEDSPFYSRSLFESSIDGVPAIGIHESLDLGRFALPWVQALIPFRAPRRA